MIILTGCSSQKGHGLVVLFFPSIDHPANPAPEVAALASTNAPIQPIAQLTPPLYIHQPYAEQKCSACHLTAQSEVLRTGGRDLCLECHKLKAIADTKGHATMGTELCWTCHEPHRSEQKGLLKAAL